MVKFIELDINDYYWDEDERMYINKKYKNWFYEYHEGQTYDVNGVLIAIRRKCGTTKDLLGPDGWYYWWGSIDDAGEEWRITNWNMIR